MLPLWPNQLLVTMGAEHIAVLYRTGITKKVLAQRERAVEANHEHTWQNALQTLEGLVTELAIPANTNIYVSLASDLVRYLVLPSTEESIGHADKHGYAQAAFREVFGAESLSWAIQFDDAAPSKPTVCVAMDQGLLDGLYALAAKRALSLKSIQPYAIKAINALRAQLSKTSGIVLIVENARLILATFQRGTCTQLRAQPLSTDWQNQLPELLARTALLEEEVSRNVAVYAPAYKTSTLNPVQDWQLKRLGLSGKHSEFAKSYAMLEIMA